MKARGDFLGQEHLGIFGVAARSNLGLQRSNVLQALKRQQGVPVPHQVVRNGEDFGEHGVGLVRNAHVVVLGFGHFLHTIQTHQQRHGEHALRLLPILLLQVTTHHQVEFLVGTAQLQVGLEGHRVIPLQQRIQKLVQADGVALGKARMKIVALHHAGHGVLGRQFNHAAGPQRVAPFAVVAHLGFCRIEHLGRLGVIGFGVGLDLRGCQRWARAVAPRRVANQRGEVTNQENDRMPQILQLAQFVEHHGVAQMDVRSGRVQPQLDAQGRSGGLGAGQFFGPFALGQ